MKLIFFVLFLLFPTNLLAEVQTAESKKPVLFHLKPGASLDQTARRLKSLNLIQNVFYFKFLAAVSRAETKIKAGEYLLEKGLSSWQILNLLVEGKSLLYPVTFREGLNLYEMARILHKKNLLKEKDFISLCYDPGFIYELIGERKTFHRGLSFSRYLLCVPPGAPPKAYSKNGKIFLECV